MSTAEKIYDDLSVHPGILGYITAADIHWVTAPQGTKGARIVYKMISDVPIYDSDDKWQRWRFYISHPDWYKCRELADVLKDHLNRKNDGLGTMKVSYVGNLADEDPVFNEDSRLWEIMQDYSIAYIPM
jgi:hypothetical protein